MNVLKALALGGGEWIIFILIASSILALAVCIERFIVLRREKKNLSALRDRVAPLLSDGKLDDVRVAVKEHPGSASRILYSGLVHASQGLGAVEEQMASTVMLERNQLETRLLVLGTLGNNTPFIGLLGTVMGVIKAFHDLAREGSAGPEVVMQGLSEALIATAVGLFVAIPCVIAFNYFQKQVRDIKTETDALTRLLMARLKASGGK
ncbi:MAG TPA: MotA/TolQ/ExbB proton channel family protein [Elusimicrobiota bacterium]|nr:MotA/TolQ/ExbB proton channel family protein [Elusimicrobiota bacterium]